MIKFLSTHSVLAAVLGIIMVTLLCYCHTLYVPFVFDDSWYFEKYSYFRSFDWMFQTKYWTNFNFRSVALASFTLNYKLHALWLPGYHLVSIAIHAINGILVFFLVKQLMLFRQVQSSQAWFFVAACAAALFIVHPIQTQAVVYTIQRMTGLATMFYLAAIFCYVQFRTKDVRLLYKILYLLAVIFCYYLSLFSKQTGATIIASIFAFELLFSATFKSKIFDKIMLFGIVPLFVILCFGLHYFHILNHEQELYLLTQAKAIILYLQLLFLPLGQSIDHLLPLSQSFGIFQFFGVLLFFTLIFLIYYYRRKAPLFAFGIAWFIITMQVESSIFPIKDTMVEHRLYLPMVGLSIAFASVLLGLYNKFVQYQAMILKLVVLLFVMLAVVTVMRNVVWRSASDLWIDAWKKNKSNMRALNNAGYALIDEKKFAKAQYYLGLAVMQTPDNQEPMANLAYVYYTQNDTAQVRQCLDHIAIRYGLNYYSRSVRGLYYASVGRLADADRELQECIAEQPHYYLAYSYLGEVYYNDKQYKTALHWFTLALRNRQGNEVLLSKIKELKAIE